LKPSTRHTVLMDLRSILCRFAVEAKYLPKAPELPKPPRRGKRVVLAPTYEQVKALLASARPAHKLAFSLAAFAGLRACEVRALRWMDVDVPRGEIVVRLARCYGVTDRPKSGDERPIPIGRDLRALLEERGERPREELVALAPRGNPWCDD